VQLCRDAPRIVVPFVVGNGVAVQHEALVEVLIRKVLVPTQSVCIGEVWVNLQRSLEKLDGCFVLLL
jgi:hypothetical protein